MEIPVAYSGKLYTVKVSRSIETLVYSKSIGQLELKSKGGAKSALGKDIERLRERLEIN